MICSICIATYKRKDLLKNLLNSLLEQTISDENIELQVLIVDNDAEKSAENVVSEFKDTSNIKFQYFSQPLKNISLTRNVAANNAIGEYLLFVDDDQVAVSNWVNSLVSTSRSYNAEVVIGRVLFQFEDKTPEWIKNYFSSSYQCPPTGTEALKVYTGNCLIKASVLKDIEGPFDPKYGISGGEDVNLFRKLKKKGAKFVNCYEGAVTEFIPAKCANADWILKRTFRQGFIYTFQNIETTDSTKIKVRLFASVKSIIYGLASSLLTLILFFDKSSRIHWLSKVTSNYGHLLAACGYRLKNFSS